MKKIKMRITKAISPDGTKILRVKEGDQVEVADVMADLLVAKGHAIILEDDTNGTPAGGPATSTKAKGSAPENKGKGAKK